MTDLEFKEPEAEFFLRLIARAVGRELTLEEALLNYLILIADIQMLGEKTKEPLTNRF